MRGYPGPQPVPRLRVLEDRRKFSDINKGYYRLFGVAAVVVMCHVSVAT